MKALVLYKEKQCLNIECLKVYRPNSGAQKFCDDCKILKAAEGNRNRNTTYRERNREEVAERVATWQKENSERRKYHRLMVRLRKYSLSLDQYNAMLILQNFRCAICKSSSPDKRATWHIDHDHKCCPGKTSCGLCVRGLLCLLCNSRLAIIENLSWLNAAKAYLGWKS